MIRIFEDLEGLSQAAAELLVLQASATIRMKGVFHLVLSGGNTPRQTYQVLAGRPFRDRVDWSRVHVWWGDERCVAADDARSNYRMAREELLDHIPIPKTQIHRIRGELHPQVAARDYQSELERFFQGGRPRFDFALLGMGEDGHTASLFPGSTALAEQKRWAVGIESTALEVSRVSLTPEALNEAALIAFLVAGSTKAAVVAQVLQGPLDPWRLPTQLIHARNGKLHWLLDQQAAAMLNMASAESHPRGC